MHILSQSFIHHFRLKTCFCNLIRRSNLPILLQIYAKQNKEAFEAVLLDLSLSSQPRSEPAPVQSPRETPTRLEDVIAVIKDHNFLHYQDIKHLHLVSKALRAATSPFIPKISITAADVELLSRSALPTTIQSISLRITKSSNSSERRQIVSNLCSELSFPNLLSLGIHGMDQALLPQIGLGKWPNLKRINIFMTPFDTESSPELLMEAWQSAKWPLEHLGLSFVYPKPENIVIARTAPLVPIFPQLKTLRLAYLQPEEVESLSEAALEDLEDLELRCGKEERSVVPALAQSSFPRLQSFKIICPNYKAGDMTRLTAESSWFKTLKALELQECLVSRQDMKALLQGFQEGGEILSLSLRVKKDALLEFSGISLPLLQKMEINIDEETPSPPQNLTIDRHLEAVLVKCSLPNLIELVIEAHRAYRWSSPPELNANSPIFLPSLKKLELQVFYISGDCLRFLGQYVVHRLVELGLTMFWFLDEPLGQILSTVPADVQLPLERLSLGADVYLSVFLGHLSAFPRLKTAVKHYPIVNHLKGFEARVQGTIISTGASFEFLLNQKNFSQVFDLHEQLEVLKVEVQPLDYRCYDLCMHFSNKMLSLYPNAQVKLLDC